MLTRNALPWLAAWIRTCVMGPVPWTSCYGLARTLLALATGLTLLTNPAVLLLPSDSVAPVSDLAALGLFHLVPRTWAEVTRVAAGLLLLGVATGWRPRLTGIIHWYLTFSLSTGFFLIEGGDQIASILTFLLIPVTLTDPRRSHWSAPPSSSSEIQWLVAAVCLGLVRFQVAGVYFHAAVGKFAVAEWADGTALYYWLLHPVLGAPEWLRPMLEPLLLSAIVLPLTTWGVLALEFALAAGLIAARAWRPWLLACGVALHAGIILVHGLVSFGAVMFAALILYLWPRNHPFPYPVILRGH